MEQKLRNAADRLPETELQFEDIRMTPVSPKRRPWRVIAAVAASLVLLISLGFGTYAYAAELREYNAAIAFFGEYDLPTEGLTRAEIKAVYRDITTQSFAYSKTAEVIRSSLTAEQIAGYEIYQPDPGPQDVEDLWNYKNYGGWFVPWERDVYQFHLEHLRDETGKCVDEKYYLEKYDGETPVWRVYLPFWHGGYTEVADGIVVYGHDTTYRPQENLTYSWIGKIDTNGNLLWLHMLQNGFAQEVAKDVVENEDGSYTLFSRGGTQYLCVSRYTPEGERTLYKQTDVGTMNINNVAAFGDGYLLEIGITGRGEFARFVQVDREGNVTGSFSYSDDKNDYVLQDMLEFNGKVYVSAYAIPKQSDGVGLHQRQELQVVLDYLWNEKVWNTISDEELLAMVRANYTAVLLVCDPEDDGELQTFYSIPGSLGAALDINDAGMLIWEVESLTTMRCSPATSAYTFAGTAWVYQYTFDPAGYLIGQIKTDEAVNFYR